MSTSNPDDAALASGSLPSGSLSSGSLSSGSLSSGSLSSGALLAHAASVPLEHEPVPPDQRVAGSPRTALLELQGPADIEVGVWEMTPGSMRDVEVEELFVVLRGAAQVLFEDTGAELTLRPGDVVRLRAGERTVWSVTETLRKVYFARAR